VERKREILEREAKERQANSTGGSNPQLKENFPEPETGQVRDKLAAAIGVSGKTYESMVKTVNNGNPEQINLAIKWTPTMTADL